jgi:hypothetical protein
MIHMVFSLESESNKDKKSGEFYNCLPPYLAPGPAPPPPGPPPPEPPPAVAIAEIEAAFLPEAVCLGLDL